MTWHSLQPERHRRSTAASLQPAAPRPCERPTPAAGPDTPCDLTGQHGRATTSHTDASDLHTRARHMSHTLLGGLVEGWGQQGRGVEGGAVLQEHSDTGGAPTTAGVKKRSGPICGHSIYLWGRHRGSAGTGEEQAGGPQQPEHLEILLIVCFKNILIHLLINNYF